MKKRRLRIELGINLEASTITKTDPAKRLFPLQNALVDVTNENKPEPFWYSHLRPHDELSIRLVDITDLGDPRAPANRPTPAGIGFTDPNTGDSLDPFDQKVLGWKVDATCTLRHSPVYSAATGRDLPTWDLLWKNDQGWQGRPLTLAAIGEERGYRCFEMSMALEVQRDGRVDHFIFDPEMIVSETDN